MCGSYPNHLTKTNAVEVALDLHREACALRLGVRSNILATPAQISAAERRVRKTQKALDNARAK